MNNGKNGNDSFVIPNPIYDVVFKYLMEDLESAKIVISTLINEKIIKLDFVATSHAQIVPIPKEEREVKLFHPDFTALVELPDGSTETVMIELQKAKVSADIFRFKRYICANFQKKKEIGVTKYPSKKKKNLDKGQTKPKMLLSNLLKC